MERGAVPGGISLTREGLELESVAAIEDRQASSRLLRSRDNGPLSSCVRL